MTDGKSGTAIGDRMQAHAVFGEQVAAALLTVEKHQHVFDHRAGIAQGFEEGELAAAVGDQILDQQYPRPGRRQLAFEAGGDAVVLGFFADVEGRLAEVAAERVGKRDAGGFAAGDGVESGAPAFEQHRGDGAEEAQEIGVGNHRPAVHVDRAEIAGGQTEGLAGIDLDRPLLPQTEGRGLPQTRQQGPFEMFTQTVFLISDLGVHGRSSKKDGGEVMRSARFCRFLTQTSTNVPFAVAHNNPVAR